jgi:Na+-transporting methylmalonyl-CoA/oxaloacetate decarboxylase gamma subunit
MCFLERAVVVVVGSRHYDYVLFFPRSTKHVLFFHLCSARVLFDITLYLMWCVFISCSQFSVWVYGVFWWWLGFSVMDLFLLGFLYWMGNVLVVFLFLCVLVYQRTAISATPQAINTAHHVSRQSHTQVTIPLQPHHLSSSPPHHPAAFTFTCKVSYIFTHSPVTYIYPTIPQSPTYDYTSTQTTAFNVQKRRSSLVGS